MASLEVRSGQDGMAGKADDKRAASRAAFRAWVARRLEWERLLRKAGTSSPATTTALSRRAA